MLYPELPVSGFIAAALVLIPLPRQIRAKNIACIALIFWFFEHCLIASINAIIWDGSVENSAPVWCDITIRLRAGEIIAFPAATLCICKHLEFISSGRPVTSDSRRLRRTIFEVAMCFGLPVLWMILNYCFQSVRFVIDENFGCFYGTRNSKAINCILLVPTLVLAVVTLVYGAIALYHLIRNQKVNDKFLSAHLKSRDSALSSRQYYRLMVMSLTLGVWGVAWICLEIAWTSQHRTYPLGTWETIHKYDSFVLEVPTIALGSVGVRHTLTMWWAIPGAAYLFFILFGTSYEVLSEYLKFWNWFRTTVLRRTLAEKTVTMSTVRSGSIPVPLHVDTTIAHDDLESKMPTSLVPTQLSYPETP